MFPTNKQNDLVHSVYFYAQGGNTMGNGFKNKIEYDESSITSIIDDILRIRTRHQQYIGYDGILAVIHLLKEGLQNSIDEAAAADICNKIFVTANEITNELTIEDNGRGIPQGALEDVCTIIQSSGKFNKGADSSYSKAAGENGVGLTCINGLSTQCTVISIRDNKRKTINFEKGKKVNEKIEDVKSSKTGTIIKFIPDKEILGDYKLDRKKIFELCQTMSYLGKIKITCNYTTSNGKIIEEEYNSKNGIIDLLNDITTDERTMKPVRFVNEDPEKGLAIEAVFTYDPENPLVKENGGCYILSYANFCTTVSGGTHVNGFKDGIYQYFNNVIDKNFSKKKGNTTIKGDDCRDGMVAVINVYLLRASFVGQVKEKLATEEMQPFMKKSIIQGLKDLEKKNGTLIKSICSYIIDMAKARTISQKEKKNAVKKSAILSPFSVVKIKQWSGPATDPELPKQLYVVEGDSAGGSMKEAADKRYQEIFKLRGVSKIALYNVMSYTNMLEAMDNEELKGLVTVCGAGFGSKFELDKFRYEYVIVSSDADIDGNKITSGITLFFFYYMRPMVEAGRLYKVFPPLYKIEGKNEYIMNNKEYADYLQKTISSKFNISQLDENNKMIKMSEKELSMFLLDTKQYYSEFSKLSNKLIMNNNKDLLETVLLNINYLENNDFTSFQREMKKKARFLNFEQNKNGLLITGSYNYESQFMNIDRKFMKNSRRVLDLLSDIRCKYRTNFLIDDTEIQLIDLLSVFKNYEPPVQRYKGLGEMNASQLTETVMTPGNRQLVRLTIEDFEREDQIFRILHDKRQKYSDARKEMMQKFIINPDDIDN